LLYKSNILFFEVKAILSDVMAKAKKIFLLCERRETWRVRLDQKRRGFCPSCNKETIWLTVAEAARFSASSEREIFRLAESGKIHFRENETRILLICRKALEESGWL
jgi:hypothetical protein